MERLHRSELCAWHRHDLGDLVLAASIERDESRLPFAVALLLRAHERCAASREENSPDDRDETRATRSINLREGSMPHDGRKPSKTRRRDEGSGLVSVGVRPRRIKPGETIFRLELPHEPSLMIDVSG